MNQLNEMDVEELRNLAKYRVKKFVSLKEGAMLYSVGKHTFREQAMLP